MTRIAFLLFGLTRISHKSTIKAFDTKHAKSTQPALADLSVDIQEQRDCWREPFEDTSRAQGIQITQLA